MRTSWNNKRIRRKKRIWNKRNRPGKTKDTKMATRRKPTRKNDLVLGSYPLHSRHSSGNSILKLAKVSPPFHSRRYKPSRINTPPWSKKDPECTSLQPSATLPSYTSNTNSAIHLSTVNVHSFLSPFTHCIVTPETGVSRDTKGDRPEVPATSTPNLNTHSAYHKRFDSVEFQTATAGNTR